jgi:hypothetical protein
MHPTKTTIRRLACTAGLVLTALAVFATGAAADSGASGSKALGSGLTTQAEEFIPGVTDFPSRLGDVGESGGAVSRERFVPGVTDFPSRLGESGERAAEARLAHRSAQLPVYVQTDGRGFDWSAAASGATAATLLLLGAALAGRIAKRNRVAIG